MNDSEGLRRYGRGGELEKPRFLVLTWTSNEVTRRFFFNLFFTGWFREWIKYSHLKNTLHLYMEIKLTFCLGVLEAKFTESTLLFIMWKIRKNLILEKKRHSTFGDANFQITWDTEWTCSLWSYVSQLELNLLGLKSTNSVWSYKSQGNSEDLNIRIEWLALVPLYISLKLTL